MHSSQVGGERTQSTRGGEVFSIYSGSDFCPADNLCDCGIPGARDAKLLSCVTSGLREVSALAFVPSSGARGFKQME